VFFWVFLFGFFFFARLKYKIAGWAAEASLKEKPYMFVSTEFFYPLPVSEETRCSALENCFSVLSSGVPEKMQGML